MVITTIGTTSKTSTISSASHGYTTCMQVLIASTSPSKEVTLDESPLRRITARKSFHIACYAREVGSAAGVQPGKPRVAANAVVSFFEVVACIICQQCQLVRVYFLSIG